MYLTQKPSEGKSKEPMTGATLAPYPKTVISLCLARVPHPRTWNWGEKRWSKYLRVGLWTQCHTWGWETLGPSTHSLTEWSHHAHEKPSDNNGRRTE